MPTRILLAEDHALVRQGVRALLAAIDDFAVVGGAANGREALRLIRALAPEVALMDISMPELNGLDATARALREQPQLKVIIVSMHATEAYVLEALRAGAAGYLLKDADAGELERAIRAVARGERYLTPAVSQHLIGRFLRAERGGKTAAKARRPASGKAAVSRCHTGGSLRSTCAWLAKRRKGRRKGARPLFPISACEKGPGPYFQFPFPYFRGGRCASSGLLCCPGFSFARAV